MDEPGYDSARANEHLLSVRALLDLYRLRMLSVLLSPADHHHVGQRNVQSPVGGSVPLSCEAIYSAEFPAQDQRLIDSYKPSGVPLRVPGAI